MIKAIYRFSDNVEPYKFHHKYPIRNLCPIGIVLILSLTQRNEYSSFDNKFLYNIYKRRIMNSADFLINDKDEIIAIIDPKSVSFV
jgi:hypothetical protein